MPADAAFLAFDFTVKGDPAEDLVTCAVGGQNVFSLPARFVEPEAISSTDMIDISRFAGQNVEFYFGFTGGTSSDCELSVEGVRFISLSPPELRIERGVSGVKLSWPSTATGWVPEGSASLREDDWQPFPDDASLLEAGSAVMERVADGPTMFYRLRRIPTE